jgi:uncharacterized protein (TIGR02246 family)
MKTGISVLASAAMFFGSSMAFSQTKNGTDVTAEIQDFCNHWADTWTAKGTTAVANTLVADDILFIPPNGAVVKGKAAIAKVWTDVIKGPTVFKCTVEGAKTIGDGALAYGEDTISGESPEHDRWTAYYTKEDGQWKVQLLQATIIQDKK